MVFTFMERSVIMWFDYFSFEFGREDGTRLSEEDFISEHNDVVMTSTQWKEMLENLEAQAFNFLREYGNREIKKITGHCKKFVFIDKQTNAMYFKPLYEIDVKVFFKNLTPILLIYDMKMTA